MADTPLAFGPFRLDARQQTLTRDGRDVALTPKSFALLLYLASRAGRLASKDELLSALWSEVIVGDASIKVAIREIRKALGDDADTPRYIQTIHRRGYRFIAAVTPLTTASTRDLRPHLLPGAPGGFVGREQQLRRLVQALAHASSGMRQCLFMTGDAGTGKSALLDAFIRRIHSAAEELEPPLVMVGHCFEQFGIGEPYLPVWEALARAARERPGTVLDELMSRHSRDMTDAAPRPVAVHGVATQSAPPQRQLRDLADAIERLAAERPLLLVLEDAHWADPSTIDLLSALARRRGAAQLMLVVTLRPAEANGAGDTPLGEVVAELAAAQLAQAIALPPLEAAETRDYLHERFPAAAFPDEFPRRLHQRTGGHPLFLVRLVDDLLEQGVLVERNGTWRLADADGWQATLETQVPQSVRAMIESQLARLDDDDRRILEAAAVAGVECSAAAIAGALEEPDLAAVEERCDALARRQRFIAPRGSIEWPDATLCSRYVFLHQLHHNVVYQQIGAARRAQLHRALGARLEQAWGNRAAEQSAELAMHFERGRDWRRAVDHLRAAADAAARQHAHREAIAYLRRADAALGRLPVADRASAGELPLLVSLGVNLQIVHGCAAPQVEEVFARAEALCSLTPSPRVRKEGQRQAPVDADHDPAHLFAVLWGVWVFHKVRSELDRAAALARRLLELAEQSGDRALLMQAHQAMCVTFLCLGQPAVTAEHMTRAAKIYDPQRHPANTPRFGQDPGVACFSFGSVALWLLGRQEEAGNISARAIELSRRAAPSTRAMALHFAAMLNQLRGDAPAVARLAAIGLQIANDEGYAFWRAGAMVLRGWACAAGGRIEGIEEIRHGLHAWLATGSRTYHPYYLGLLADALLRHDRAEEATQIIDQALAAAQSLQEGMYEAQLRSLRATAHALSSRAEPGTSQSSAIPTPSSLAEYRPG